ncbi:hypothetical protein PIB30_067340 [Stylosanthes scabra]|uniref:2-oxo-4-hydroxy-4-carboxy-5-ureidoimidazoline decarboxylase n=1 Tax=Stylosanthes scabra TaxID=79078 RepID=A0ABU6WQJ8_9FABA|nr:hypothetical protein [Stylosanthes scabra]
MASEYGHTSFSEVPQSFNNSLHWIVMEESNFLECCGSMRFAMEMASASPFSSLQHALNVANDVWFNKINIHSWLMALNDQSNICEKSPYSHASCCSASTTAMNSILQEIYALSMKYLEKFGFPYFRIDFDWDTDVILMDLKRGYIRSTTESPLIQAAVKDFDLNKKPYPIDDLDPVARENVRRFCEIWSP